MYDYDVKNNIIYLEYIDTDLRKAYNNSIIKINESILYSLLFQILYAIMCYSHFAKKIHRDLQPNNIFIKYIDKDSVFIYKINNINYYVPSYGYLFMIGDFGLSGDCHKVNYDFHNFLESLLRLFVKKSVNFTNIHELYELIPKK